MLQGKASEESEVKHKTKVGLQSLVCHEPASEK